LKKLKIWNNEEEKKIITTSKGEAKTTTKTSVLLSLSLLLLVFILGFIFSNYLKVDAQLLPIPPLSTDKKADNNNGKAIGNDHQPPIIQILTNELIQGKNVFRVKIIEGSGIKSCEVKYSDHGSIKTADCVYDKNNVYKTLINANAPSQAVEIYARDPNGNSATIIKNLSVKGQLTALDFISNMVSHLLHSFRLDYMIYYL
jgi:hypothetical protein